MTAVGYNYHLKVEGATGSNPWSWSQRSMDPRGTLDDMCASMLEEMQRAGVRRVYRVTVYEGNRILLDWGPMHVAIFRAFCSLMPMDDLEP